MTLALHTRGLSKAWGNVQANRAISLSFPVGARHALIGPNGAGKTTFINLLTGVYAPSAGEIYLGDERITDLPQHQRVRRGMARTFQINALFPGLTVLESVVLVVLEREATAKAWFRSLASCKQEIEQAYQLLSSLHLQDDAGALTHKLPYGKQRLLEIALALATKPKILFLDEPAAGIPTAESNEVFQAITQLPGDVTLVFIEHDMGLVFRFADRISVLVDGGLLMEGTPDEIAKDQRVREIYLGEAQHG